MASEMSYRAGLTISALVGATNSVTINQYEDFVRTAPLRTPLPVQEGGQTQNINAAEQDPDLAGVRSRIEARVARRNKAMEDAARAAAAAFDAGTEAESNPVKLDSDRKLKAI